MRFVVSCHCLTGVELSTTVQLLVCATRQECVRPVCAEAAPTGCTAAQEALEGAGMTMNDIAAARVNVGTVVWTAGQSVLYKRTAFWRQSQTSFRRVPLYVRHKGTGTCTRMWAKP